MKQRSGKLKIKKLIKENLKLSIKMDERFVKFGDIKIEKYKFQ